MNNGKICVSVCAAGVDELLAKMQSADSVADIVEVRFDGLSKDEFNYDEPKAADEVHNKIVNSIDASKLLTTFRSFEQNGFRDSSLDERLRFWSSVYETGYADLEEDVVQSSSWGHRICSHHDFHAVPEDLDEIYERLRRTGADIVKLAVTAADAVDAIPVWQLFDRAEEDDVGIIPIAMGEAGKWTRILGLAHGAFMTYASLDDGGETAPGQVTGRELKELYRAQELSSQTKVFGILGDPVSQSLSRFMHNPAFRSVGFDGVFIPFLVKDIAAFMRRMVRQESREVELNFGGFSVTMPHKQAIIPHLDDLDATAEKIGAVNTVKIDGDKLIGYNTDAHGFITPLLGRYGDLRNARVAVFGAGGASRACVFALQREQAAVQVFVRNPEKAAAFGSEFGIGIRPFDDFAARDFDIFVNATPIGMSAESEDNILFTRSRLEGVRFVYDLVTKPYDTALVMNAKAAGADAIGGVEMLIAQGVKQFELWTGEDAPVDQMRESIAKRFAELTR